jgi:tetratricopeptide (TPR) repeat protein
MTAEQVITLDLICVNSNQFSKAIKEKDLGNEAYKKKDFATAHQHYDKAIALDPTNITFYNNKAGICRNLIIIALVRDLDYPNFFQKSPPMNID